MPYLYAVEMSVPDYFNPVKIGYSINPDERVRAYCGGPFPVRWLGSWPVSDKAEESFVHRRFSAYRLNGEWFYPAPYLLDFINLQLTKPGSVKIATSVADRNIERFNRKRLAQVAAIVEGHENPLGGWDDNTTEFLMDFFDRSEVPVDALKSTWRY